MQSVRYTHARTLTYIHTRRILKYTLIYKTMFFNGSPLIQFSFLAYKQKPSETQTNSHRVENRKQKIEEKKQNIDK